MKHNKIKEWMCAMDSYPTQGSPFSHLHSESFLSTDVTTHRQMSCLEYGTNLFRFISLVLISSFYLVSQSIKGILALSYFSVSQTGTDRTKWWMNYCQIKRTNGKKIHSTYYTDKSETSCSHLYAHLHIPFLSVPFHVFISL